jgi:hypothetical protein
MINSIMARGAIEVLTDRNSGAAGRSACDEQATLRGRIDNIARICTCALYISVSNRLDGQGSVPGRVRASGPVVVPPELKQFGHLVDHSPATTAEINNGGAIPPLPFTSPQPDVHLLKDRVAF